jgi:signal transduction histidine kinase
MTASLKTPDPQELSEAPPSAPPRLIQRCWRDPWLSGALLFIGLLLGFQLFETLTRPAWSNPVTDWMRAALAWPALVIMVLVSRWATRHHQPEARAWWILSVALLVYAVARTLWSVDDQLLYYPKHAPFPDFPDPFFMLQYPFYFLAVILIPSAKPWGSRVKLILDGLLIMGAATSLVWYCLLAPLYLQSHVSPLGRFINLYYPAADLVVLFGLTVTLIYHQSQMQRLVMALLIFSILCLVTADFWVAWLIAIVGFTSGSPPDLFWLAFYLLLPFSGLAWLRITQHQLATQGGRRTISRPLSLRWQHLEEVMRFLFPLVIALLASAGIAMRAILWPLHPMSPLGPILVIFGLLFLVMVRQALAILEMAQLRQERELARANELAVREANRQMEAFLGIVSHELKTPLASMIMGLQLIERRASHAAPSPAGAADQEGTRHSNAPGALELVLQQAGRLNRLVGDLLETSRIQSGRLGLDVQPTNLTVVVNAAVAEQRQLSPERTIHLHLPGEKPLYIWADAERIGQVVANYLTNALKYSPEARGVEVGVGVEGQQARVWVQDQGPGIPLEEQSFIWERFHRVTGIEVQSGSGVGLGLGLYISKTIIERQGGQVGVQSTPGQGATFWFTLPLTGTGH